jgi:lysophospholipase L1-like esterase
VKYVGSRSREPTFIVLIWDNILDRPGNWCYFGHTIVPNVSTENGVFMRIVCLGDSLTYGFGLRRGEDWVSLAALATGHRMINKGICGDTTGGMLARFGSDVLNLRPDAVILMGGANDILTSGSDGSARSNMAAMIQQASASGVIPIVALPIPTDPPGVREEWLRLADFDSANRGPLLLFGMAEEILRRI